MRESSKTQTPWREEIAQAVRGVVRLEESLAAHTTLGIGGAADLWFEPADIADLSTALSMARRRRVSFMVLGGGSNVLVADEGYRGMVIHIRPSFTQMEVTVRGELVRVSYCAGMSSIAAHRHALESELIGLEFLAGIPGTIGGAVRMNAGTRLGAMADVVEGIELVRADGVRSVRAKELGFSYRRSTIPEGGIVTRVAVLLRQGNPLALKSALEETLKEADWRRTTQPRGRSAGCTFKNPPDDSAGRLIEQSGLKGRRVGGAFVSDRHANFLMSDGSATASDMLELISLCRREVEAKFGVRLELEWKLMGGSNAE